MLFINSYLFLIIFLSIFLKKTFLQISIANKEKTKHSDTHFYCEFQRLVFNFFIYKAKLCLFFLNSSFILDKIILSLIISIVAAAKIFELSIIASCASLLFPYSK